LYFVLAFPKNIYANTMRILFTLTFLSLSQWSVSQADKSGQFIKLAKDNYKIEYPASWTLDTSGLAGSELFVLSPLENDTDKFRDNVSVIIQNLAGQNIDLDKYKDISETQIAGLGTNGKIFESSKMEATAQGDYYKLKYTLNQGNFKLIITSHCYIKNEKAYLITFTSESGKYELYREIGNKILDSFQFTK
jgi:photosystem II reaction center protein PsbP